MDDCMAAHLESVCLQSGHRLDSSCSHCQLQLVKRLESAGPSLSARASAARSHQRWRSAKAPASNARSLGGVVQAVATDLAPTRARCQRRTSATTCRTRSCEHGHPHARRTGAAGGQSHKLQCCNDCGPLARFGGGSRHRSTGATPTASRRHGCSWRSSAAQLAAVACSAGRKAQRARQLPHTRASQQRVICCHRSWAAECAQPQSAKRELWQQRGWS